MRGHQPPMDRLALFRGRRFPDVQKGQRNGHRQIRCRAILRLTHLDTSMAKGEFRTARLAAWRCRDRNDEASLFRQVVGKGKQRGVLVCRRLDPAVLRDPREQMNASWSPGKLLVDVAFPIGNDRDPRSLAQHLRGAKHSIQPALRFLVGRWPLAAWSDLATRAIAHRHVDRAKQRPRRRINRQNSMQQQSTYSPAAPHRSKSASPCRLAPERQFTAVLDRQDIASRNQAGGPRRRGRRHLGDGHGLVVQKTRELDLPGPMASRQPTDARSWPRDQRSFLQATIAKLSQPNCIANPCHRRPPANQQASRNQPSSLEAIEMCAYDSREAGRGWRAPISAFTRVFDAQWARAGRGAAPRNIDLLVTER